MLTDTEIYNNVLSRLDKSIAEFLSLAQYEPIDEIEVQMTEELEVPQGLRGASIGAMNKYFGGNDKRKRVLAVLFASDEEELSTKSLTDAQWYALYKWIGPWKDEDDNTWKVAEIFPYEAIAVLAVAGVSMRAANAVKDPLFGDDGKPSETVGFLLDKGGEVTKVVDDVIKTSLLDGTNFGKMMKGGG